MLPLKIVSALHGTAQIDDVVAHDGAIQQGEEKEGKK